MLDRAVRATLWRVLNDAGYQHGGVVNVPFTYPPEQLDGFQISGMDTPSENSAFVHPPELRAELEEALGSLDLESAILARCPRMRGATRCWRGCASWTSNGRGWRCIAIEQHPCDVMMVTFMSIDTVQHYFWHHMDPRHFLHDPKGAARYGDAIQQVYRRLDAAVGRILERLPEDCTAAGASPITAAAPSPTGWCT